MASPENALEHPVIVHVHVGRSGPLWKTGHGHHVAQDGHDESSAGIQSEFANGQGEVRRCTEPPRVVTETVLRLCHAHR